MIFVHMKHGEGCSRLDGSRIEILTDLTILNAHLIKELDMSDEEIRTLFEETLEVVDEIRRDKK